MTTVPPEHPIPQPLSKSLPTVQSSHPDIAAVRTTSGLLTPLSAKAAKHRQDAPNTDFISKSATLSLIRRTLIIESSHPNGARSTPKPIEATLPPLTSSNDIDLQLYAIVAIVVKDFVATWYSKITQDHTFIEEIVQIIAHCSRALEQRIRHVDVAELILDELPVLLEHHIIAYRTATSSLAQQSYDIHPRVTYHNLNPHPALTPVPISQDGGEALTQSHNEAAYRQILVNGALAILLPTEDLQNAPLRILVGDILADLIIGQALAGKVCEGWFLHDALTKAIAASKQRLEPKASGEELRHKTKTRLEHFGLMNARDEIDRNSRSTVQSVTARWFWRVAQWMFLTITVAWSIMQGIFSARHLPKRSRPSSVRSGSLKSSPTSPIVHEYDQSPQPVLAYRMSNFFSTMIRLRDRMPWLAGTIMFCQHVLLAGYGRAGATNSVLDRFLHHGLVSYLCTPPFVVLVLTKLRSAVFPNNSLAPPAPPPPSPAERIEIRRQAAKSLLSLLPPFVARRYFGSDDEDSILAQIEEDILDAFSDKYMNKHLIYGILELILVRLIPELQETGVGDLLEERGISWGEAEAEAGAEAVNYATADEEVEKRAEVITGLEIR